MNIDEQVNQIVQNIVTEITTKVQQQALSAIETKIADVVTSIDTGAILGEKLSQKIDERLRLLPIDTKSIEMELAARVTDLITSIATTVQSRAITTANEAILEQVRAIDFPALVQTTLIASIQSSKFTFPDSCVPATAINPKGLRLSGENIAGGIIKNFGSTGIDDKATACQLSIFDEVTVVENNLLTKDLTVKGTTTIEGDLIVTGTVPESSSMFVSLVASVSDRVKTTMNEGVFDSYADLVFNKIKTDGLDLAKITYKGDEVINGGNLGNHITFSNLQRVGTLSELRVSGEALLSQTLYTTSKRIGINTVEPAQALSIWDQEIEIGFGKRAENVAVIEVPRSHTLIIGSNKKSNLILTPDGGVAVEKISVGTVVLSSAELPPSNDAPLGSIVFNANPSIGGPLGWVSLGGARWANFGFID